MFRTRHAFGVLFAGLLALAAAPFALAGVRGAACDGPPTPEEAAAHARDMADHLLGAIEATPEQRVAIGAIVEETVPELLALHEEGHALREALREAMATGADPETLEALRLDGADLFDRGSQVALRRLAEVRGHLTDAQWQTLQGLHAQHHRFGPPPFGLRHGGW